MLLPLLLSSSLALPVSCNSVRSNHFKFSNEEIALITENLLLENEESSVALFSGCSDYGNATEYSLETAEEINCFGYAIDVPRWVTISLFQACTI